MLIARAVMRFLRHWIFLVPGLLTQVNVVVISFLTGNEAWIIEMRRARRKQVPQY